MTGTREARRTKMLEAAISAARAAGRVLIKAGSGEIEVERRMRRDIKLAADRESERAIISILGERFPEHAILSEECGRAGAEKADYQWIIDPLDGTYNFSRRIPIWCTSIGLVKGGDEILGVILDPSRDELFSAERGKGAFLNDRPIRVSRIPDLAHATIGFAYGADDMFLGQSMTVANEVALHASKLRALGSAALHLAYVACARLDAFIEFGINHWDMAAGLILIREAGGRVSTRRHDDGKMDVAATNGAFHDELLKLINW